MIKTEIGYTTPDTITVREMDLSTDIIGKLDFVDMIFLTILARIPTPQEKVMTNAILVATADHGITPSSVVARLTYRGAPESLQGAIASGLLGAGNAFLGTMQNSAQMLIDSAQGLSNEVSDDRLREVARETLRRHKQENKPIYGLGHSVHKMGDPRVPALRELSRKNGFYGVHWRMMDMIPAVLESDQGKKLPLNLVAAVGAIMADMGLDPLLARGFAIVGRSAGLLAHLLEEKRTPIAGDIFKLVFKQDPRNVPA